MSRSGHAAIVALSIAPCIGRLILLGDIFHDLSFRHLDTDAWQLLRDVREFGQERRREVVWLHGNHDRKLGRAIASLLGIEGHESFSWHLEAACMSSISARWTACRGRLPG